MKTFKILCLLLILVSYACKNENPPENSDKQNSDKQNCNTEIYNKNLLVVKNGMKYDEEPSQQNCDALKQAAKDLKKTAIECDLWEDEPSKAKAEIEEIINKEC